MERTSGLRLRSAEDFHPNTWTLDDLLLVDIALKERWSQIKNKDIQGPGKFDTWNPEALQHSLGLRDGRIAASALASPPGSALAGPGLEV